MTHPKIISNFCVKDEGPMFLYKKGIDRTQIKNFSFQLPYPELALLSLGQTHDTSSGHKQYLCQVRTFNDFP